MIKPLLKKFFKTFLNFYFSNKPNQVRSINYKNWIQLVWSNEDVSRRIALKIFERNESEYLTNVIKSGDVILDLGSNVGYYSNFFAFLVGPNGKVLAVDANPKNTALLNLNKFINGKENNIFSINAAIGNSDSGMLNFNVTEDSTYGFVQNLEKKRKQLFGSKEYQTRIFEVPVRTIDSLNAENGITKVHFIKMDVEGFEFHAFKGMEKLLSDPDLSPELMMVELVDDHLSYYGNSRKEVFEYLLSFRYLPFILENKQLIQFDNDIHQNEAIVFLKKIAK